MKIVGLKVLKNKLSEYVRIAAAGETVLVTDRDRVVAELNPPLPEHKRFKKEVRIERGIREGWITPAKVKGPLPPPPPAV
jgi:antitoxin (DNA-binding transcriptional repressor) of toxin-antitoxin stability system